MQRLPLLATSLLVLACVSWLPSVAHAQTATVTYDLVDVWLLPDITHPNTPAQQMTGTFVWTYPVGDFQSGSGQFVAYLIPWWGNRTSPTLGVTVEIDTIEFTMQGNYHGLGLDLTLRPTPPLSPLQPSPIDLVRSAFDIEVGVSHRGHVSRGSIVPRCPPPQNYGSASAGSGGFFPTIRSAGGDPRVGNGSFRIDGDQLLGGADCFLILGVARTQLQFLGITILVDPAIWLVVPQRATGTSGAPGSGAVQVPTPIPNDPGLVGAEIDFQILALDAGSPQGVAAATNGLSMVICQ